MKGKEAAKTPYRRRYGLIWRPGTLGVPETPPRRAILSQDGGDDAPLSARNRTIFRSVLLGIFVVFVVMVLLTARGY